MKHKFLALYGSPLKLSNSHKLVTHHGFVKVVYYVRADIIEAEDLSDSLDKSQPQPGEILLNTVAIQ